MLVGFVVDGFHEVVAVDIDAGEAFEFVVGSMHGRVGFVDKPGFMQGPKKASVGSSCIVASLDATKVVFKRVNIEVRALSE